MANVGEARIRIDASSDELYRMISDVTRMGEWSPECYRCDWEDGATGPEVGARFRGYNRRGESEWDALCTVVEAEPGRAFAFVVGPDVQTRDTTWRYEFGADGDGTAVIESFDSPLLDTPEYVERREARIQMLIDNMGETLARIKAIAEAG